MINFLRLSSHVPESSVTEALRQWTDAHPHARCLSSWFRYCASRFNNKRFFLLRLTADGIHHAHS